MLGLAGFAACAEAGGETVGGDLTEAGKLAVVPPPQPINPCDATRSAKWTDLYNEIFGPTGKPGSCVFTPACHGSPNADGARGGGIECFDRETCRQSFFDKNLTDVEFASRPYDATLFKAILRSPIIRGPMPREPADYVFPQGCIDRIAVWIKNGSPND